jgi:hypothetical protein
VINPPVCKTPQEISILEKLHTSYKSA